MLFVYLQIFFGKLCKNSCPNAIKMAKFHLLDIFCFHCPKLKPIFVWLGLILSGIMTYSAPKKNLFAFIILLSLLLHLLFFAISAERNTREQYRQVAESLVTELANEVTVALLNNDHVSASLIATEYAKEPQVGFVGVYDAKNNLIVPKGSEGAGGYRTKNETVATGDKVLGSVVIETKAVSYAILLSEHWLFLLSTLVLHALIFMAYGYVARPSKELKLQIATDVRARLLTQNLLPIEPEVYETPVVQTANSAQEVPSAQADVKSADNHIDNGDADANDKVDAEVAQDNWTNDAYVVQVRFDDPHQLLQAVSYDGKQAYFALCDQLLAKSVEKLLTLPLLAGVSLHDISQFDEEGASVQLIADNEHAKPAIAAAMLAKLILMVNQVVYDKHRELGRFALPMHTTASNAEQMAAVQNVAKRRRLDLVLLFDAVAKAQLSSQATLNALRSPNSIAERECQTMTAMSQHMAGRLNIVRNAVLLDD